MNDTKTVVGTWNFVEAWDVGDNPMSPNEKTYPWGDPAAGYWAFDSSGHMGLHISANPPLPNLGDDWLAGATTNLLLASLNANAYMAYFGTYTFDGANITIQVFNDVLRAYTGTPQVRPYKLSADGDELLIGDGVSYLRRLVRLT
jgi:lipocalin-like protein